MERQRLAIIGCGDMETAHQEVFHALADRIEVVGTADLLLDRAEHAAQILGARRAVTDYRELLDEVDACLIVTPHDLHHEIGMRCLESGKHVLMEKPMAITEDEGVALIDAAQSRGLTFMVAFPMRFHPLVSRLKELLDSQYLGETFHLSIWTEQLTMPPEGHWIRSAARLGGGQFISHGCHYVDLLLWMLGNPVRGSHFGTELGTPWMEREGTSDAVIQFESGATGYHFGTWGARATRNGYSIQAHCTEGLLEANLTQGKLYAHRAGPWPAPRGGLSGNVSPDPALAEVLLAVEPDSKHLGGELAHFVDCLQSGTEPLTTGPDSLQGLRIIWRMYEAEQRGVIADLRGLGLARQAQTAAG